MMKKIMLLVLTLAMILSLCACNVTMSSTVSNTENGNTTTTTTTTENGVTTSTTVETKNLETIAQDGEVHTVPLKIINDTTEYAITGFYMRPQGGEWGENLIDGLEVVTGDDITGSFNFDANNLVWDLGITVDGVDISFKECDFSKLNEEKGVELTFTYEEDGWNVSFD